MFFLLNLVADKSKSNLSLDVKKETLMNDKKELSSTGSGCIAAQTFTFRELAAATKNFRADCLLGEGGFGRVYKGRLESSNQVSSCCASVSHFLLFCSLYTKEIYFRRI